MALQTSNIHRSQLVGYTIPITASHISILSAYNVTNATKSVDLMDSFLSYHPSYYIWFLLLFSLLSISWSLCSYYEHIKHSALWIIMSCSLFSQCSYPKITLTSSHVITCLSSIFFFLYIYCFMLNMLSTDLIVIVEPKVIKDYQDIVSSPNVRAIFIRGGIEYGIFASYEDNQSFEYEIFHNRSLVMNFHGKEIMDVLSRMLQQSVIGIVREWMAYILASMVLMYAKQVGNDKLRVYLINDPTDKKFESAFIVSKNSSQIIKSFAHQV